MPDLWITGTFQKPVDNPHPTDRTMINCATGCY